MPTIIHFCAPNDRNGNPRRLYVLTDSDSDEQLACWDESYYGYFAVPGQWRSQAACAEKVSIKATQYNKLKKLLPSPKFAHDVKGYSHLRF